MHRSDSDHRLCCANFRSKLCTADPHSSWAICGLHLHKPKQSNCVHGTNQSAEHTIIRLPIKMCSAIFLWHLSVHWKNEPWDMVISSRTTFVCKKAENKTITCNKGDRIVLFLTDEDAPFRYWVKSREFKLMDYPAQKLTYTEFIYCTLSPCL